MLTPLLSAVQTTGVREVSIGSLKVRTSGVCTVPRAWLDAGVAEMAAGGLTEAEIAGSEKLKGAMEKDALDAAVRAMTELGVTPTAVG